MTWHFLSLPADTVYTLYYMVYYIKWFTCRLATRRARGVRPCLATASSVATMRAPAPSLIPEALAAVTVPSFLNKDLSFCILSIVASGLRIGAPMTDRE